jgi:predicted nucleic acid-binding protein
MFLVDTNIISDLVRPQPNSGVLAWADKVEVIAISAITVEEIYYGLSWKPNPRILVWFEAFFDDQCRVLPVTPEIARCCGRLRGNLQSRGTTRTQADMLIAATAIIHQLTLVTRNVRDFDGCQVALLNPFT